MEAVLPWGDLGGRRRKDFKLFDERFKQSFSLQLVIHEVPLEISVRHACGQ
jgi:hypothetical protein